MLVAAHNGDLAAAAAAGLRTAFVARPTEYGPHQKIDIKADGDWDVVSDSFTGRRRRHGLLIGRRKEEASRNPSPTLSSASTTRR